MKITKGRIRQIIAEEIAAMEDEDLEVPVGADIDMMADEEDVTRPGGRAYVAPGAYGNKLQAVAPRARVNYGDFDRPLQADVGQEIVRLSRKAELTPMQYLKSLGFSSVVASNLLAMAGMFDDAEEGMTFRESKRVRRNSGKRRMKTEARLSERGETGEGSLPDYKAGYEDGMSGADIAPEFAANPSYRRGYADAEEGNYNPPESRHRRTRRM
jgi:hypothetical protein